MRICMHTCVRKLIISTLFYFLFLSSFAFADSQYSLSPYASLGSKVSEDRSIGVYNLFLPLREDAESLIYSDLRIRDTSGSQYEWNAGLGYRVVLMKEKSPYILGFYAMYDRLKSPLKHYFSQGTAGAEIFTQNYEFRVNGYFPESKSYVVSQVFTNPQLVISGTSISTRSSRSESRESALPGFDIELGRKIPLFDQDIWLYGAYYYFDRSGYDTIQGPRVRSEWRVPDVLNIEGSRLTFEAEVSHDRVRETEYFLGASMLIPLEFSSKKASESKKTIDPFKQKLLEPIHRDLDIVSATQTAAPETVQGSAINPVTGQPYSSIHYVTEGGVGDGSLASPGSIPGAVAAAGTNGIVAVLQNGGNISTQLDLNLNGQTAIGGGGTLQIRTPEGLSVNYLIPGARPTFNGVLNSVSVTRSNVMLSDFNIVNALGDAGVVVNGVANATVQNISFMNSADKDINLNNVTGSTLVSNISSSQSGKQSIYGDNPSGTLTIQSSNLVSAGLAGIAITRNGGVLNVVIQNNTITDPATDGISIDVAGGSTVNASISGNNVSGPGGDALNISGAGTCNNCTGP